jgi:hypothetical protein
MRFIKTIAATLALTIGATAFAGAAQAGHRHHHGDALVAGIFGFAAGAILSSALAPRYYYQPAPVYAAPQVLYGPTTAYYGPPEPWTSDWFAYCSDRYRSFDPQTGYFLGYDGNYHFCE